MCLSTEQLSPCDVPDGGDTNQLGHADVTRLNSALRFINPFKVSLSGTFDINDKIRVCEGQEVRVFLSHCSLVLASKTKMESRGFERR